MTSQRVKNKKVRHETKSSGVAVVFTRCDVFRDLLQYTHTEKCYLHAFVLYNKSSNGLLKDFWGMKKEKQVCWRGFDANCVCPLSDHGQQPMKMPTDVTLLYNVV